nr:hypothetical protein CFP56_64820 [Quercus suber]
MPQRAPTRRVDAASLTFARNITLTMTKLLSIPDRSSVVFHSDRRPAYTRAFTHTGTSNYRGSRRCDICQLPLITKADIHVLVCNSQLRKISFYFNAQIRRRRERMVFEASQLDVQSASRHLILLLIAA